MTDQAQQQPEYIKIMQLITESQELYGDNCKILAQQKLNETSNEINEQQEQGNITDEIASELKIKMMNEYNRQQKPKEPQQEQTKPQQQEPQEKIEETYEQYRQQILQRTKDNAKKKGLTDKEITELFDIDIIDMENKRNEMTKEAMEKGSYSNSSKYDVILSNLGMADECIKSIREKTRIINRIIKDKDTTIERIEKIREMLQKTTEKIIDIKLNREQPEPQQEQPQQQPQQPQQPEPQQVPQPQENKLQKPVFLTEPEKWNGRTYGNAIYIAGVKHQLMQHQLKQCKEYEEKTKAQEQAKTTGNPYKIPLEVREQAEKQQQKGQAQSREDNSPRI